MNGNFPCQHENCGRVFHLEKDLNNHVERRHGVKVQEEKEEVNEQQEKIRQKLFGLKPVIKKNSLPAQVTSELVLETSGQEALEDVTELILRDKNLKEFSSNEDIEIEDLVSLEYLCLSHNVLTNIDGVTQLLGLYELNINNNLIADLSPLESLSQLKRLFCANNLVKVMIPIKGLKQLTEISVYNNKLFDLEQTLKVLIELPKLKVLEIDRNPCVLQTPNSRYKVLYKLKLETLDGEPVTDVDEQITYNLFGEREVYVPKNLVGKLRTDAYVHGSIERDLLYEEIDQLKESLELVTIERDALIEEKQKNSKENVDALKDENVRLRREVASMYALLDEINELRNKMKDGLGSIASEIYEENYRLKARILELEAKQKEDNNFRRPHTSAGIRPVTASSKEIESDEIYEFLEQNEKMLKNLETKVTDFKRDLKRIRK